MPRTTTLECSGCPPLRALTFDTLGLIKVIEARDNEGGVPRVVERWGEPDPSKCVLTTSMVDRLYDPLLAVARKNGSIEILNPLNGKLRFAIPCLTDESDQPVDDPISGIHLFSTKNPDSGSKSCTLLTCSEKGKAMVRSFEGLSSSPESASCESSKAWDICNSGSILCSKVDHSEKFALFGGKGVEMNVWDLNECAKTWTAKSPRKDSLGIFTPTWFTSTTFLSKDDHRKFVAGTNSHQVRLYDISAQRRPVISIDFRETPIKAVAEDVDGYTIYIGNGSGDLASIDMRTGKLLGSYTGKCAGSIRSIVRHPELPVVASCGLDSYLRLWHTKTRKLLAAVFLKQHLVNVVIDSKFPANVNDSARDTSVEEKEEESVKEIPNIDDQETKKKKKKRSSSKEKKAMNKDCQTEEETPVKDHKKIEKSKSKKKQKRSSTEDSL